MKQARYLIPVIFLLSSCGSTSNQRDRSAIAWDDLTTNRHHYNSTPVPGDLLNAVSSETTADNALAVKSRTTLQQLATGFQMENPALYEGGVYGKKGHVPVFAALLKDIPNYDRLYWVMVKVLSEKYGCFIKRKQSSHAQVIVECRDRRRVVFYRNRGDNWIQFYGRQYDQKGRELVVRNHKAYVIE